VGRGDKLVSLGHTRNNRVASNLRALEHTQEDVARWLALIAHIVMPNVGGRLLLKEALDLGLVSITVDDMEPGIPRNGTSDRLVVALAEVVGEALLRFGADVGEVLVAKDDDFALADEEGEVITLLVGEGGELHAFKLCPHLGGDVGDGH